MIYLPTRVPSSILTGQMVMSGLWGLVSLSELESTNLQKLESEFAHFKQLFFGVVVGFEIGVDVIGYSKELVS